MATAQLRGRFSVGISRLRSLAFCVRIRASPAESSSGPSGMVTLNTHSLLVVPKNMSETVMRRESTALARLASSGTLPSGWP
ncbi:hypothetical protein D3C72_1796780 [compost metagenome]